MRSKLNKVYKWLKKGKVLVPDLLPLIWEIDEDSIIDDFTMMGGVIYD